VLGAVEAAGLPEGAGVEEGRAGALVAGTGAVRSGAVLADAGPTVPEPVPLELAPAELAAAELAAVDLAPVELAPVELAPVELVVELAGELEPPEGADELAEPADDAVEPTDEVGDDVAEPTAEVTGDVAEPTGEVTGDVAEPTVEVTWDVAEPSVDEVVDVRVALRGDRAEVDAWAGRENSSMATKMPAPTSAACTAVRAMRRAIGCMSSPPRRETRRSPTLRRRSKPRAHGNAVRPPPYSPVGNRTRAGGRGEGPEPAAIAC
jgi:hypothetical protein